MATSADIQKFARNNDGYIEYYIKVVTNGREWIIKKRFSEFYTLNSYLTKHGFQPPYRLPDKKIWKTPDEKLLRQRQKELQMYLNELLLMYSINEITILKEFFELEMNVLIKPKNKSFHEIKYTQKLEMIPRIFESSVIKATSAKSRLAPNFVRNVQILNRPMLNKTKSLSFSTSAKSPGRFDMGHHDLRERKFSIDIFNLSGGSASYNDSNALSSAFKKTGFLKAVDSLWEYYKNDIESILNKDEAESVLVFSNYHTQSISREGLPLAELEQNLITLLENTNTNKLDRINNILIKTEDKFLENYHKDEIEIEEILIPQFKQYRIIEEENPRL